VASIAPQTALQTNLTGEHRRMKRSRPLLSLAALTPSAMQFSRSTFMEFDLSRKVSSNLAEITKTHKVVTRSLFGVYAHSRML
jgi:hypothetical protein